MTLSVFLSKKTVHAAFADRFSCNIQAINLDITSSEWDYVPLLESPDNMCVSITSISSLYDNISGADLCVRLVEEVAERDVYF
jgi:hypothetical protein